MIIDGHAHALAEFADIESLVEIMDSLNVDKVVLCPGGTADPNANVIKPKYKQSFFTTRPLILLFFNRILRRISHNAKDRDNGNTLVSEIAKKLPDRVIQFYWVNILDPDYPTKLKESYGKWKFKGIKLHQCVVPFKIDSPELERLVKFAQEKGLPIFIHIFTYKEANKFVKLVRRYPEVNFILAHLMGLENFIKNGKDLKNIYFDISTYYIISQKRIKKAMKYFGVDHVLLGSDSPLGYDNLKNNIEKIQKMKISELEKEMILGKNMVKLLNLQ